MLLKRIVRTKAEKCSTYKYDESTVGDVSCPSNSSENNQTINECHSSTNSSDGLHLNNSQPFNQTWNYPEPFYNTKDSRQFFFFLFDFYFRFVVLADSILITVEEEKASILDHFYQQNPFADYSQMDEIQQRTQLDEQIIRVISSFSLLKNKRSSFISF